MLIELIYDFAITCGVCHNMFAKTINQSCHFLVTAKFMHNDFLLNQQLNIIFGVNERVNNGHIVAYVRLLWIVTLLKCNEVP